MSNELGDKAKHYALQGVANDGIKSQSHRHPSASPPPATSSKQRKRNQGTRESSVRRVRLPLHRSRSDIEIERYAEDETDEDFSDILGGDDSTLVKLDVDQKSDRTLILQSKLSSNSWLGDVDDEDDPFAQLEEGLDEMDLEANIARDKYARLRNQVESMVTSIKTSQDDEVLADISEQLVWFTLFAHINCSLTFSDCPSRSLPFLICRKQKMLSLAHTACFRFWRSWIHADVGTWSSTF